MEQADRLESMTQENGKLMQKIAGLEGQVSAHDHEHRAAVLAFASPFTQIKYCEKGRAVVYARLVGTEMPTGLLGKSTTTGHSLCGLLHFLFPVEVE